MGIVKFFWSRDATKERQHTIMFYVLSLKCSCTKVKYSLPTVWNLFSQCFLTKEASVCQWDLSFKTTTFPFLNRVFSLQTELWAVWVREQFHAERLFIAETALRIWIFWGCQSSELLKWLLQEWPIIIRMTIVTKIDVLIFVN